jgi:5-methylcytosine-specific restriction endonuclease McrA
MAPGAWREEVWRLDRGRCVNCGKAVPLDGDMWSWNAHHPVEKQKLPPSLRWDPRNGVVTCRRCHERHTTAAARIPGSRLPGRCWDFARELGGGWSDVLDRAHPD